MIDLKQWPKMEFAVNKNILPVQPKTKYGTMLEAVDEYANNYMKLEAELDKDIVNNPSKYSTMQFGGSPGMMLFPPIEMGYGYTAHIGTTPSVRHGDFDVQLNKQFRLKANNSLMTVGIVMPAYGGKHGLAVFTEDFLTTFEKTSLLNRGAFFFIFCHSGLLASRYGKIRWLFAGGLASGEIKDDLYYFNKLSSCMNFPDRAVTNEDLKLLENDMWQVKI